MADSLIVVRTLQYSACALVLGPLVFRDWIAAPLFEDAVEKARQRAITAFVNLAVWSGLALATVSAVLWLVILSARMANLASPADLSADVIATVLTDTQFGHTWLVRGAITVALVVVLARARHAPRAWRMVGIVLACALIGTLAWAGHNGATEGVAGEVHVAGDALHLIAAGTWIGALPALYACLSAGHRGEAQVSRDVTHRIVARFSTIGTLCVAMLIATGLINAWMLLGSPRDLIETDYGRILLAKLALFAAMLAFAAVNRLWLAPRLAREDLLARARAAHRLAANGLIEFALGVALLAIVGVLGTLPPDRHPTDNMPAHSRRAM